MLFGLSCLVWRFFELALRVSYDPVVSGNRAGGVARAAIIVKCAHCKAYLPGSETDHDQEGGVSTARPLHCTPGGLTRTTTPNRGGSRAQFLIVGTSVRAVPII